MPQTPAFTLRGLNGRVATLRCADLVHIDNRHTPQATFIDIPALVRCIQRATGTAIPNIGQAGPNPPGGGAQTVYEVNGIGGNATGIPNSARWRVVVNTQTQRITTAYNLQPGQAQSRRAFTDCA
ncbi:hypothetical protein [Streptomyces sp. NPDC018045]|uniref:hypothetical protein n=1 Tax=Streptomyces sp. NPDC018045 TaxID=3365037 RepID=UPI0037A30181